MADSGGSTQIINHTGQNDAEHIEREAQVNKPCRKCHVRRKHEIFDGRKGYHQKNPRQQVRYQFCHAGKIYYLLGKSTDQRCKKMFVQAPQGVGPRKFRSKKTSENRKMGSFFAFFQIWSPLFHTNSPKKDTISRFSRTTRAPFSLFFKFGVHFSFQKNKKITNKLIKWTPNQKLFEFGAQFFEKNSLGHL